MNNMVSEHPLKAGKDLFDGPSFKATHEWSKMTPIWQPVQ